MIKWILNSVPRGALQRVAGWVMPLAGLFYAVGRNGGKGVECPLCGARFRKFMPYGYVSVRKNALCPACLSLERHRLLWLWMERETNLLKARPGSAAALRVLHIAPEVCLSKKLEKMVPPDGYVTADLESPLAKIKMDVQAMPFDDDSFDVVICNHVLEHVDDDRRAMGELYRVMRRGGWGVALSPVDETREVTFEDDSVVDHDERTRLFGQYDHRRVYGRDYADRLRQAGFRVDPIDYFDELPPDEQRLFGLRREVLYVVTKAGTPAAVFSGN